MSTSGADGDGANREQKSVISEAICCGKERSVERRQEEVEAKERDCTLWDGNGKIYTDVVKNETRKNVSEIEWLKDEVKMSECTQANVHFTNCQGRAISGVGKLESEVRQLTVWTERGFQQNRMINKSETSRLGSPDCSLFPLPAVGAHPDDWGGSSATPTPRPTADAQPCSFGATNRAPTSGDPCQGLFQGRMGNADSTKSFQGSCFTSSDAKSNQTPPPNIFNNCSDRKCYHTNASPCTNWFRANGIHVLRASILLQRFFR